MCFKNEDEIITYHLTFEIEDLTEEMELALISFRLICKLLITYVGICRNSSINSNREHIIWQYFFVVIVSLALTMLKCWLRLYRHF